MFSYGFPRHWSTLRKLLWLKLLQGAAAVVETVTGTLPLTLANALSHAILSLTRCGLCTQDGTPTPDSPVDIVCNNGALRMVDDELPAAYKRVLGFSMENNAYWEIPNFPLNGSDTLRFSFEATDSCNVIGAYSGSASGNNYSLYVVSLTGNYLRYKNGAYNSIVDLNTRYDVEITPTGSSGMKVDSTWTAQTFTTPTNLCIGTTAVTASSAKLKGKLYGNIEIVGRAKFIPCERVSDNALGYYDTVGGSFYEQASGFDGAVSLGYDGSHYTLGVVGTPEVLTVRGKNLFDKDNMPAPVYTAYISNAPGEGKTRLISGTSERTVLMPIEPNTTYTVTKVYTDRMRIAEFSTIPNISPATYGTLLASDTSNAQRTERTITTGATAAYLAIQINNVRIESQSTTLDAVLASLQVEEGSTATDYEPYVQPQTVSVPMLLSVGDYKDTAELISGLLTHKVGVKMLTGAESEEWNTTVSTKFYWDTLFAKPVDESPTLCTRYNPVLTDRTSGVGNNQIALFNSGSSGYGRLVICDPRFTTVADFKAYLAAQYAAGTPVIVVYPLATETTEQTTAQHLSTHQGTNIVDSVANVGPVEAKVEYMKAA